MAFTKSWVETDPDGSVITVSQLDNYQRDAKIAIRERLEGDPAVPDLTGLIESGSFTSAPKPRKGAARVYVDTDATILAYGVTKREDGRLAVASDTRKLYHVAGAAVVAVVTEPQAHVHSAADITSGILTVTRGGTGVADPTAGNLLVGNGSSPMSLLAPGAAGGFVRSNGAIWQRDTIQAIDLPAHTHAETDITDGALLARLAADETITGAWTFDPGSAVTAVTVVQSVGANGVQITGGVQTSSQPFISVTQTWNAGATVFEGLKVVITNTASSNASTFASFKAGAVEKFAVYITGMILGASLSLNDAAARIIGGATSLALRNNANTADNVLITDAGSVTIRSGLDVATTILVGVGIQASSNGEDLWITTAGSSVGDYVYIGTGGIGGVAVITIQASDNTIGMGAGEQPPVANQQLTLQPGVGKKGLVIPNVTQTTSQPMLDLSQTFNAGGVQFDAVKINIVDTASLLGRFLNLQNNGTTRMSFYVSGAIDIAPVGVMPNAAFTIGSNAKIDAGASTVHGIWFEPEFQSTGAPSAAIAQRVILRTQNTTWTLSEGYALVVGVTKGASNTITTLYGIKVQDISVGGTNYAIHTGTGRIRFGDVIETASGQESTGAGSAALGSNSPAGTLTAPNTWIKFRKSDGTTLYVPAWA